MPLNPNIAMGYRGIEVPNQLAQYGQVQQLQANQMKMQEAQAAAEERNALRQLNPASPDYENQLFKVNPQLGIQYRKERSAAEANVAQTQVHQAAAAKARNDFMAQGERDLARSPSDANITAWAEDTQASNLFSPQEKAAAQKRAVEMLAMPIGEREKAMSLRGATTADYTSRANNAATVSATMRGQNMTDARARERLAAETDPAFQQKLAEAKALGTNMAKDKVLRETQLPKVLDTAEMALNEVDALIGKRDKNGRLLMGEKPHAGFETAVGSTLFPGARFIPGTSASDFQSRFDQIKGGAFLQAFETLKGGGSITNVEGDKGTAALNRMSLAQSEKEFVQAAREFQDVVRKGVDRAKKLAGAPTEPTGATPVPSVVRLPTNVITNPQFPGFSIGAP